LEAEQENHPCFLSGSFFSAERIALHSRLYRFLKPPVQHFMKVDFAQQRQYDPALSDSDDLLTKRPLYATLPKRRFFMPGA
jgi:hypothetical protein